MSNRWPVSGFVSTRELRRYFSASMTRTCVYFSHRTSLVGHVPIRVLNLHTSRPCQFSAPQTLFFFKKKIHTRRLPRLYHGPVRLFRNFGVKHVETAYAPSIVVLLYPSRRTPGHEASVPVPGLVQDLLRVAVIWRLPLTATG